MKRIQSLMLLFLLLCSQFYGTSHAEGLISIDSAMAYIEHLSEVIGPHPTGSKGDSLAQNYIAKKMASYGLEITLQRVDSLYLERCQTQAFLNTANIIGYKSGTGNQTIVIGAHYDTQGEFVPGANDNSTGVAVLLELARVLSGDTLNCNIFFVAFAAEELGLIGSRYFVEHLPDSLQVKCMFNIDMIGREQLILGMQPGGVEKWEVDLASRLSRKLNLQRMSFSHFLMGGSRIISQKYSSDHLPFLEKNIPVFCLGAGVEPFTYHSPSDIIDFVNVLQIFGFLLGLWLSGLLLFGFKDSFREIRLATWASRFLAPVTILLAFWPGVDFAFYEELQHH